MKLESRVQYKQEARTSTSNNFTARTPPRSIGGAYERFLQLPVVLVLVALWLSGVVLMSTCVVLLYLIGATLLQAEG